MLTTHAAIEGLRSSVTLPASSLSPSALACFAHWLRVPVNSPGLRAYSSSAMLRSGSVATALRIGADVGRLQGVWFGRPGPCLPLSSMWTRSAEFTSVFVRLSSIWTTTGGSGGLDGLDHP